MSRGWMQRRIAGLAAALGLLAVPQLSGTHEGTRGATASVRPQVASAACDARPMAAPGCPRVMPAAPAAAAPARVFPVRGRHDFGSAINGFGGGRGHDGQDIFAVCGTRIVAARAGRVVEAGNEGNEGTYVVMEAADGRQQAYLHLLRPSPVRRGDRVGAGESIGKVGETGNADGCHLHFELWTAPGRFTGGSAVNPRPALHRWASEA
jgi:murein DD-endopeptidase MepM/ murein hydrolase activator NlpD